MLACGDLRPGQVYPRSGVGGGTHPDHGCGRAYPITALLPGQLKITSESEYSFFFSSSKIIR